MEPSAQAAAGETTRGGQARLLACCRRFLVSARSWGGRKTGPNPTDRARPDSKHHILVDANGVPVSAILTAANAHDVTQLLALVDAIPRFAVCAVSPFEHPRFSMPIAATIPIPTVRNCASAVSSR